MGKTNKAGDKGGKGKGGKEKSEKTKDSKDSGGGGGKAKGAQSINVRHILVSRWNELQRRVMLLLTRDRPALV